MKVWHTFQGMSASFALLVQLVESPVVRFEVIGK